VAEEFLHGTDILPGFEQMRRKAVAEAVRREANGQSRLPNSISNGAPDPLFVKVMPPDMAAARIPGEVVGGEDVLPNPCERRVRVLAGQSVRHLDLVHVPCLVGFVQHKTLGQPLSQRP